MAKLLTGAGIFTIGALRERLRDDFWTRNVPNIGEESGRKIVAAMYRARLIDESFESYKETFDAYYRNGRQGR